MKYHFAPEKGWMNDPNGLIYYKGQYHAFFQHNPHDIVWGPMHWGHAISKDLVNWEEQEIALYPDQNYENDGGCFSGSAIEKDGKLYLIYTSVSKEYGQSQSVAWSEDGLHFVKYDNNPVITHFPEDATYDFRDPKVFEYQGEYRMIVGTKYDGHGRIVQYKSQDLLNWIYVGILFDDYEYDNVIECPDLFEIDGKWVLMYSLIGKKNCREQFIVGDYDGNSFVEGTRVTPEYGPQFYAAQTFKADDKRILIGWLYDWDIKGNPDAESVGVLTIPREVRIVDGVLKLYPVESAATLLEVIDEKYINDGIAVDIMSKSRLTIESSVLQEKIIYQGIIEAVEILSDDNTAEIFVNKGECNFSLNMR